MGTFGNATNRNALASVDSICTCVMSPRSDTTMDAVKGRPKNVSKQSDFLVIYQTGERCNIQLSCWAGRQRNTGSFVRSNVAYCPNAAQRLHARTTSALIYNGARSSYVFRARRAFKTRVDDAHLAATKLPTFRTKRSKRRRGFLPHDWTILGKCPLPSRTPSSHAKGKRFLPERFP